MDEIRAFDTGATRSADIGRYDPEGFLSPIALERYCIYMQKHRHQPDGSIRDSDNWQKGLPLATYMKGMWRHFLHLWTRFRGHKVEDSAAGTDIEEDLCALLFNVQGMLHETLKAKHGTLPATVGKPNRGRRSKRPQPVLASGDPAVTVEDIKRNLGLR